MKRQSMIFTIFLTSITISFIYIFVIPPFGSRFISERFSKIARSFIFKDRIMQMFEENKNLIKRIFAIAETADDENVAGEQTFLILEEYRALQENYSYLIDQQLSGSDKEWGDWSIEGQWAELVYQLLVVDSRKSVDPKRNIKDAVAKVIMESKLFDTEYFAQYISDRLAYDRIQVGELRE